jgi:hypothetical protein
MPFWLLLNSQSTFPNGFSHEELVAPFYFIKKKKLIIIISSTSGQLNDVEAKMVFPLYIFLDVAMLAH